MQTCEEKNETLKKTWERINFMVGPITLETDLQMGYFTVTYYNCEIINIEVYREEDGDFRFNLPRVSHAPWQKEKLAISFYFIEDWEAIRQGIIKHIENTPWLSDFFKDLNT